ncbi:hypothetical protein WCU81_18840 [Pectobacterium atrosepticum]|uniref:hypothetical protein n=1 Tax=Pectobacterium atrosepticum TaxID=29471 RepID=UPI0004E8403A|nr:hypothetical protein [Pectobacterium atrosepticum]GKV87440.1 hypothetical protein PEC301296_37510 [Pectobacterium carotovorum subsp. carotovorum]AIK12056.1 hypothetical protein GZ59_01410 [Pectobacterium atrosepticum]KFX13601.1 hypothetical protein JV34_14790 [Pectobacterium atrosepticum]KMK83488.1 hypothetical protein KCQ_06887 [Pectobacterium atrosepticum ICMP 1526]MCL6392319.1 hypothetical protein [Pectobacterium atrosepticum]
MQLSEYLKYKMESDKVLATHLGDITKKLKSNSISLTTDLYSGMERTSWYSSCLFEKYNDVCQELQYEDSRMVSAIKKVFKRDDVILDMVKIYTDNLMKDFDENKQKTIAKAILGVTSEFSTNRVIKESISYALAKFISTTLNFNASLRKTINQTSYWAITVTAFYGKVQKAAMSARHLRDINPALYALFYAQKLEMLYFLIEPILLPYIPTNSKSEEEIINLTNGIIR